MKVQTPMKKQNDPNSTLMKQLQQNVESLKRLLDEQRIAMAYLRFDVEATCRERDYWRKQAGG